MASIEYTRGKGCARQRKQPSVPLRTTRKTSRGCEIRGQKDDPNIEMNATAEVGGFRP